MKKLASILLALVSLIACREDRDQVLKVYNWSAYIDESVIPEFESWYKQQTGEDIRIIYQTFDINETMLAKIEKGHEDFDVVCPSDYIIERMLDMDLLMPLDFASLPDSINYIRNNQSPYMKSMMSAVNPDIDANNYSVPYMWGTVGILYNSKYVSAEEACHMEILRNPAYDGKIFIKDAPRDVYGPAIMYLRNAEVKDGGVTLDELASDASDESLAKVEAFMKDVKEHIAGWEADFGKEQMTQERGYISLNWSGDAVWAMREGAEIGVDLKWAIPEEGSHIWFDGWVIPKYAHNVKAATYFIDFMCRPDISIRNMDETGYVSANGHPSVVESQIDDTLPPIDLSYFIPGADSVRIDPVLYPDRSIIEACVLMHDWGENTDKLISMWSRVKGDNANTTTIVIIVAAVMAIVGVGVARNSSRKKHKKGRR
ncbi:MAG: ABC transporter substrate-binding protein [Bacteroidales bacterium]|nr:ABC transporter substrate-binding protein [Bacteroidales bacterium]